MNAFRMMVVRSNHSPARGLKLTLTISAEEARQAARRAHHQPQPLSEASSSRFSDLRRSIISSHLGRRLSLPSRSTTHPDPWEVSATVGLSFSLYNRQKHVIPLLYMMTDNTCFRSGEMSWGQSPTE